MGTATSIRFPRRSARFAPPPVGTASFLVVPLFLLAPVPVQAYRTVTIVAAADEEFRARPGWRDRIESSVEEAGREFAGFGISFEIDSVVEWKSDASDRDVAALHDELVNEIVPGAVDLVVGFAGASDVRDDRRFVRLGHSDTPGRYILVSDRAGRDLPLVLRHEFGHAFGIPHISNSKSVMNEGVESDRIHFDSLSAAILRNNSALDFQEDDPFAGCRLDALRALYDEVADHGDPVADLIAVIGDSWRRRGVPDRAAGAYRDAEELKPGLLSARLGLAMLALGDDRPREAIAILEAIRQEDPAIDGLQSSLGLAYSRIGQNGNAIAAYEAALRDHPNDMAALNNLALLYLDAGRTAEAETLLRRSVELRPGFAEGWNNLGLLEQKLGRFDRAREAFERSLSLSETAEAHRNLAGILMREKRDADARRHIEASLRLDPDQADAAAMRRLIAGTP